MTRRRHPAQYCVFGKMISGDDVLRKMEEARTPNLFACDFLALDAPLLLTD